MHMFKNGAPPDRLGVLQRLLHSNFFLEPNRTIKYYHSVVHGIISIFL